MQPIRDNARVLTAAMVGTAVEFYDFFIYGTAAALVFGPLFFPAESPAAQTLLSLMSFGVAFLARPVGAIAFGHFCDRIGRKSTLVSSLLLMGGTTLAIAFLPTYATAGWIAPALLCLMRFAQGFAMGGEWGGAALLASEYAPKGWENRFVSVMQLGSPLGLFAATGVFLLVGLAFDQDRFMAWGWRLPFLVSAVLVALGLWVRLKIEDTPAFRAALEREAPPKVPLLPLLAGHWRETLAGTAGAVVIFANFYLLTAFALAHATGALHYPREPFLLMQMVSCIGYAIACLLGGKFADRHHPRMTLAILSLASVVLGLVFVPALATHSLGVSGAMLFLGMFALGLGNGTLGNWLAGLFPVAVRYSGVAVSFSLAAILGGATTPIIAQWLVKEGRADQIGWLLIAAAVFGLIGVFAERRLAR